MDANPLVIFGALEVVRVCAGKAAIARVLTGVGAIMWVPVVTGRVVSNDVLKSIAVIISFINFYFINSRADCLIIFLDKILLSAGLVHSKYLVRFILTSFLKLPLMFAIL